MLAESCRVSLTDCDVELEQRVQIRAGRKVQSFITAQKSHQPYPGDGSETILLKVERYSLQYCLAILWPWLIFAHCSSSVNSLPPSQEAKPH